MTDTRIMPILLAMLLAGGAAAPPVAGEIKGSKPNILLVMADDQGWGDTGYNGHPFVKTPNLDAMSRAGLRFDRFYAGAPVCSPTRASVLTGRNPIRVKVLNHGHYMRPQEETVAEALKRAGYVTAHFGKWHVGSVQKQSPVCPGQSGFDEWISAPNFFDLDPYLSDRGTARHYKGESSKLVVDWTLDFIARHRTAGKPLFVVVWFPSPHDPHKVTRADAGLYADVKKGRGYFQEITVMDREFGRLRAGLKEAGLRDSTLVWYCSDNGGLMTESSGGRGKKGSIYEGGLRVPAIVEWPGRIRAGTTALPAFTSDILPTLLEIAGIRPATDHPLDGISLVEALEGRMTARPETKGMGFWHGFTGGQSTWSDRIVKAILEAQKAGKEIAIPARVRKDIDAFPQYDRAGHRGHSAWIRWPWKLHRIAGKKGTTWELYNLVDDPMETKNLVAERPEPYRTLKAELERWQGSVIDSLNGKDYRK
jgi:arylsulfatase A-like enzyme